MYCLTTPNMLQYSQSIIFLPILKIKFLNIYFSFQRFQCFCYPIFKAVRFYEMTASCAFYKEVYVWTRNYHSHCLYNLHGIIKTESLLCFSTTGSGYCGSITLWAARTIPIRSCWPSTLWRMPFICPWRMIYPFLLTYGWICTNTKVLIIQTSHCGFCCIYQNCTPGWQREWIFTVPSSSWFHRPGL